MRAARFIEGSIEGFLGVLEHTLESEELARREGLLQRLDPRVKLAGILCLILAVVASRRLEVIGGVFALACVLAALSHAPLRTLALRVWIGALVFTGLIALPAVFLTPGAPVWRVPAAGWAATEQGLRSAAYLIARVETTATLSMLLVLSTPWAHVLKALRALRVPIVAVVVLGMTYRYILLTIETALAMFESRRSRTVGKLGSREGRRLAVATAGALLGKSMQLANDVYLAMQARGFRGEAYVLDEFEMRARDWRWLGVFLGLAAAAAWAGRH